MESSLLTRHPTLKDISGIALFVVFVLIGSLLINTFVFRSFNVLGPSMESTLHTGDRLIVNRLPVTWTMLRNRQYVPRRGQIIVFKNPRYVPGTPDEFIVKRVIAVAGERVVVNNGVLTVFNQEHPEGFEPDTNKLGTLASPVSGQIDILVTEGTIFVSGDHRQGQHSYDSRNGLGLVPLYDVIGPVSLRVWPLAKFTIF